MFVALANKNPQQRAFFWKCHTTSHETGQCVAKPDTHESKNQLGKDIHRCREIFIVASKRKSLIGKEREGREPCQDADKKEQPDFRAEYGTIFRKSREKTYQ